MKRMAIALALLIAPLAAVPAGAAEDIGFVTAVSGAATLSRVATVQPLVFKDALRWRDVIQTGSQSSARLLLLGKASVTVREMSQLQLREESLPGSRTHVVELAAGKVRAAVEHSLMSAGERVEVHAPNAIVAVRGTEFVVDVLEPPAGAAAFAMLASDSGRPAVPRDASAGTTVVYTLSGLVSVDNPLSPGGPRVLIGPYEGARVAGTRAPAPFRFTHAELLNVLRGLSVAPPPPTRSPVMSSATSARAEKAALGEVRSSIAAARRDGAWLPGGPGASPVGVSGLGRSLPVAGGIGSIGGASIGGGAGISSALGGTCLTCGATSLNAATTLSGVTSTAGTTLTGTLRTTTGTLLK